MLLLSYLEFIIGLLIIYFGLTQIIIPLINRTKCFPMFLKEARLSSKLNDVNQKVVEKEITEQIKKIKKTKGV